MSKVRVTRPYEIQWMPSGGEFDHDSPDLDMDYFGGSWQVPPKQVPGYRTQLAFGTGFEAKPKRKISPFLVSRNFREIGTNVVFVSLC